jgi:hypothetical protein
MRKICLILGLSISLLFFASHAIAQKKNIGHWRIDLTSDYSEAFTSNETDSMFGMWCTQKCVFYISPNKISCEVGSKYTVLMNSDRHAGSIETNCLKIGDRFVRIFSDFNIIQESVNQGGNIGFAFALANGEFHVSRFSLHGIQTAIKEALTHASSRNRTGVRDSRL